MKSLKLYVERVVRPIRASNHRKDRMREELLAHLSPLYAEEIARGCDEPAAVRGAIERFGDAGTLSRELQASVPLIERWAFLPLPGSRYLDRRPGEPINSFLVRLLSLQFRVSMLVWVPTIVAGSCFARVGTRWTAAVCMLLELFAMQIMHGGGTLLCELIRRKLHDARGQSPERRRRARLRVAVYTTMGMGLCGSFMAATLSLIAYLDFPVVSSARFWGFTTLAALASAPLILISAWESAVSARRFEEWGTLDIESEPAP